MSARRQTAAATSAPATLETEAGLKVTLQVPARQGRRPGSRSRPAGDGDAKKTADDLTQRTDGWEFKILPSKADATLKRRDDLLEDSSS